MNAAPIRPTEKNVVLVGAGNAHLVFVRRFGMRPMPGVAVTLVSEAPVIPYSAMVPAHLAGDYSWGEITVDLVRLCQSVKVRFVAERVTAIDPLARHVHFAGRPPLAYDALSLGLGSVPAHPKDAPASAGAFDMRPLGGLVGRVEAIEADLTRSPRPFHLAVVGGGASGCELALAIHRRLARFAGFRLTLLQGNERLLPEFPARVARYFEEAFAKRGVIHRVNARTAGGQENVLTLDGGERLACDAVLWATQAAAPALIRDSGLTVDAGGFLRVNATLQSVRDAAIFGTGDCVTFEPYPALKKNGVHAVREGRVLFDNVHAYLHERPLRPYKPQRWCLALLNTNDGDAVATYGAFAFKGRWARKLKDRIDRAWVRKFTEFAPMSAAEAGGEESPLMRCGGCGSKVSGDVLSRTLKRLDIPDDPRIVMGIRAGEDASVHRARPELFGTEPDRLLEVQTVDYFKAFIDDPYLFGRIAALNAVSDLYAMNARPFSALAIATLPFARGPVQEAMLYELLTGAMETLKKLGVVLTGGHTTEGHELALGFAVTGFGEEGKLFRKGGLEVGDRLVLAKPLGSGALLAAWMRGECKAEWFTPLVETMLVANDAAGAVFRDAGVAACTDVTGFGLGGHLLEMMDASKVSVRVDAAAVPLYAGFDEVVRAGVVSSLHGDNAKVAYRARGRDPAPAWLFDPQTSGGLIAGVKAADVPAVLDRLRAAGYPRAADIGEAVPLEPGDRPVITLV